MNFGNLSDASNQDTRQKLQNYFSTVYILAESVKLKRKPFSISSFFCS